VQRLFSAFPDGLPGVSILFLRFGIGISLVYDGTTGLFATPQFIPIARELLVLGAGLLLLVGLWTPVSGMLAAILELWIAFSGVDHLRGVLLLAALGAALAMLGPGAWSVDARLFGRKRIEIPYR
jgi:putative oxidoreductase